MNDERYVRQKTSRIDARSLGEPLDPERIKLFESLYEARAGKIFPQHIDQNTTVKSYKTFAFSEGYFSNYIEGTEFTVEEAKEIIETHTPLPARDEDSHEYTRYLSYCIREKRKWRSVLQMPISFWI